MEYFSRKDFLPGMTKCRNVRNVPKDNFIPTFLDSFMKRIEVGIFLQP